MAAMASYYPAVVFLIPMDQVPAAPLAPHDDATAMMGGDRFMVSSGSRHGAFNEYVRLQCERVGLRGLEFFHPRPWESPRGECAFLFHGEDLPVLQDRLTALMLAFSEDPAKPLGDRETVLHAMAQEPTFDASLDDGQYIDYLRSVQALAREAQDEGLALLYVQFDGG
jgi:hypothetical protein